MNREKSIAVQGSDLMKFDNVSKMYVGRHHRNVMAVNQVSFTMSAGHITALVGESGSGKSTIARLVTGVEKPTAGSVIFGTRHVEKLRRRELGPYRKQVQMIFQDPYASLNPHNTVLYTIMRPLINHHHLSKHDAETRALQVMETVRLTPTAQYRNKRPHQLSGGQRQRLGIARAIAVEPDLVVADEPVSMLDVSIRADVLHLIQDLRQRIGMAVLYITHDLLSARVLADEVLVLYRGHLVEKGTSDAVIRNARHPYTQRLLEAIPNPWRTAGVVHPEVKRSPEANASGPHKGCIFYYQCPLATDQCGSEIPVLQGSPDHQVACWHR